MGQCRRPSGSFSFVAARAAKIDAIVAALLFEDRGVVFVALFFVETCNGGVILVASETVGPTIIQFDAVDKHTCGFIGTLVGSSPSVGCWSVHVVDVTGWRNVDSSIGAVISGGGCSEFAVAFLIG